MIKSEMPNNSLYTFEATLKLGLKEYPLSPNQLLLRGAQLRNTRWVYAVVVFTGHESKLMMNSTATPVKRTKVENMVNSQIIFMFLCLVVIAGVSALGQLFAELNNSFVVGILLKGFPGTPSFATAIFPELPANILTYIVLFSSLIPLSLIVTVDVVKLALGNFINNDLDMYYEEKDTPTAARNTGLIEELGQIDFLFSDKTGTLTRNIMEFKMCSIGGVAYAETVPDDKRIHVGENGKETVCNG
jgi:phospholipid-transporting ATPase